jgi:hypothetical protein
LKEQKKVVHLKAIERTEFAEYFSVMRVLKLKMKNLKNEKCDHGENYKTYMTIAWVFKNCFVDFVGVLECRSYRTKIFIKYFTQS